MYDHQRDEWLKLKAWVDFSEMVWSDTFAKIATPSIKAVGNVFASNANDAMAIGSSQMYQFMAGVNFQAAWAAAAHVVRGWPKDAGNPFVTDEIRNLMIAYIDRKTPPPFPLTAGMSHDDFVRFASPVSDFETLMKLQLVQMWTAFETLAGDLWEAAVNEHPAGLSDLKGKRPGGQSANPGASQSILEDASTAADDPDIEADEEGTATVPIPVKLLQRRGYDLQKLMGTALRGQFNFTILSGIREAYNRAFFKHFHSIDAAINDKTIETLAVFRNVIVHKAGVCDEEYVRRSKSLPLAPKMKADQVLPLDGILVVKVLGSCREIACALVGAVDRWVCAHPARTPK